MATKTAVQNMAQAGADLLAIKGAIEGEGVEIASATPTSNYAGLITNNLVKPTGTLNITENGTDIDVSQYATADVNVDAGLEISFKEGAPFMLFGYTVTSGQIDLEVPAQYTELYDGAFSYAQIFKKLKFLGLQTIPNVDVSNGKLPPFTGANFESIDLGTSLTSIGNYGCANTASVTIRDAIFYLPVTLTNIGTNAFHGYEGSTKIYYAGTQTQWENITGVSNVPNNIQVVYETTPET